jgi:outer membrane protein assembly factor BamE (lipoprotein component of BamABCDE complex)
MSRKLQISVFAGMIITAVSLSACSTLSGAESRENVKKLKAGMGDTQALNMLGTPDSVLHPTETTDRWVYEYKRDSKKGHNLFVEFKNGSLTRTGEMSGRDIAAAEENRTPGDCTQWKNPEFVDESLCTQ